MLQAIILSLSEKAPETLKKKTSELRWVLFIPTGTKYANYGLRFVIFRTLSASNYRFTWSLCRITPPFTYIFPPKTAPRDDKADEQNPP